ncbi:hypothetical protein SAMN05661096_00868 [Marivirga sericea]|uniref:DUF4382 domain-containing protein n=2 Tax=Marivirga sericea TaxID=1028 RepID=A0A1X7INF2_9BACT|nr:hypothetical protein SAMN05661096_00868 [Marivirga sericea]
MKMRKFLVLGFSLSMALLLTSCNDEDATGGRIKLEVSTTSSTAGVAEARMINANELRFTSGTITIREVVFDGETTDQSVSRTIEQIAEIDYATGSVSPEVVIEVPAGNYTSVNLGIELQDDGAEPSVVIEGTYTHSDGADIPLRFEFNSGEVFEANAASVAIVDGADLVGKITFDALDWFSDIAAYQLDEARLTEGVIVISSSSNASIFDAVADRLDVATQAVFE